MKIATVLAFVLALAGCATSSPDVIGRGDAQRLSDVQDGVVLSVRAVTIDGNQSGVGGAAGGMVGAIAGYNASGVQREGQILGVLVGVAGAAAGNAIERAVTRDEAVEVLLQLKGGERRAVVQTKGSETLRPGDAVILVSSGGKVRVTRAPQ